MVFDCDVPVPAVSDRVLHVLFRVFTIFMSVYVTRHKRTQHSAPTLHLRTMKLGTTRH
jgi:hypothetical protein